MDNNIDKLLRERYFLTTENTWEELVERVSSIYSPIKQYILDMVFIPSSPTLMNAGTKKGTLSSCFPLKLTDSIDGIFTALHQGAIVTKNAGGCGWDFSVLRSSRENIKTLDAPSSGPLAFIESFNAMLDSIRQGGKRRGAGMGLLDIDHPDIIKFITAKQNTNKLERLNLSVKMSDSFYKQLQENPSAKHLVKDVVTGQTWELEQTVKEVWDMIIDSAWSYAEPGIFNVDIATQRCSTTNIDKHVLCNPCSEFTGIPFSSCNLGSINLSKLVINKRFDWEKLREVVEYATRFLNAVIDVNNYPLKEIEQVTKKIRPIGLGIMGLAEVLYKKEIPYNSDRAIKFTEEVVRFITLVAMNESVQIAKTITTPGKEIIQRVGSYPAFDYDTFMQANERFFTKNCRDIDVDSLKRSIQKYGIRNSSFTSIAPTGSISYIANTSGGIEPVFSLGHTRKIELANNEKREVWINIPAFEEYVQNTFNDIEKDIIAKYLEANNGSCQGCEIIPKDIQKIFVVAQDLTPMEHLDILEAAANNVSLSTSKTINLPSDISKEKISEVFIEAHKRGIIGVTVYRDGSREGVLVHKNKKEETKIQHCGSPKRPKTLPCHVYKINTVNRATKETEKWVVFVGLIDNEPYEIFAGRINLIDLPSNITDGFITKIKKGIYQFEHNNEVIVKDISKIFESGTEEALTRLISTGLRHGVEIEFLISQLNKSYGTIVDFNKAIVRALKKYLKDNKETGQLCESCGSKLIYIEGCISCPQCGSSKCS